jgi:hypothetical protein
MAVPALLPPPPHQAFDASYALERQFSYQEREIVNRLSLDGPSRQIAYKLIASIKTDQFHEFSQLLLASHQIEPRDLEVVFQFCAFSGDQRARYSDALLRSDLRGKIPQGTFDKAVQQGLRLNYGRFVDVLLQSEKMNTMAPQPFQESLLLASRKNQLAYLTAIQHHPQARACTETVIHDALTQVWQNRIEQNGLYQRCMNVLQSLPQFKGASCDLRFQMCLGIPCIQYRH